MTPNDFFVLETQSRAMRLNAQRALDDSAHPHPSQTLVINARSNLWRAKSKLGRMSPVDDGFEHAMLETKWAIEHLLTLIGAPAKHRSPRRTLLDRLLRRG